MNLSRHLLKRLGVVLVIRLWIEVTDGPIETNIRLLKDWRFQSCKQILQSSPSRKLALWRFGQREEIGREICRVRINASCFGAGILALDNVNPSSVSSFHEKRGEVRRDEADD